MELRAAVGSVRWAWHEAAVLANCTLTRAAGDRQRYAVVAHVVRANLFMLEHSRPLWFVLEIAGGRQWRFPVESCQASAEDDHGLIFRAIVGHANMGGGHGPVSNGGTRTGPAADL